MNRIYLTIHCLLVVILFNGFNTTLHAQTCGCSSLNTLISAQIPHSPNLKVWTGCANNVDLIPGNGGKWTSIQNWAQWDTSTNQWIAASSTPQPLDTVYIDLNMFDICSSVHDTIFFNTNVTIASLIIIDSDTSNANNMGKIHMTSSLTLEGDLNIRDRKVIKFFSNINYYVPVITFQKAVDHIFRTKNTVFEDIKFEIKTRNGSNYGKVILKDDFNQTANPGNYYHPNYGLTINHGSFLVKPDNPSQRVNIIISGLFANSSDAAAYDSINLSNTSIITTHFQFNNRFKTNNNLNTQKWNQVSLRIVNNHQTFNNQFLILPSGQTIHIDTLLVLSKNNFFHTQINSSLSGYNTDDKVYIDYLQFGNSNLNDINGGLGLKDQSNTLNYSNQDFLSIGKLTVYPSLFYLYTSSKRHIKINSIFFQSNCRAPISVNATNTIDYLPLYDNYIYPTDTSHIKITNPVNTDYVNFRKVKVSTNNLTANHSLDMGLNSGITFNASGDTFYWKGNIINTNWHDTNNWNVNGLGPNGCLPTLVDKVIFDDSYIVNPSVQLDSIGYCKDLRFETLNQNVTFTKNSHLFVNGNIVKSQNNSNVTFVTPSNPANSRIYLIGRTINNNHDTLIVQSKGMDFANQNFYINSEVDSTIYRFVDNFKTSGDIDVCMGQLFAYNLNSIDARALRSNYNIQKRKIDITNSILNLYENNPNYYALHLYYSGPPHFLQFATTNSIINFHGNNARVRIYYPQPDTVQHLNIVNFLGTNGQQVLFTQFRPLKINKLYSSNNLKLYSMDINPSLDSYQINKVEIESGIKLSLDFGSITDTATLAINDTFQINNPSCLALTKIHGDGEVENIKFGNSITFIPNPLEYLDIKDVTVNTTTTINDSYLSGTTTNWVNNNTTNGKTYYWIGEDSTNIPNSLYEWYRVDNWSLFPPTAGDDPSVPCLPGPMDTVIFLDLGFVHQTGTKKVLLDNNATIGAMYWNVTSSVNPQFQSYNKNLYVNRSMYLDKDMTFNIYNPINIVFQGDSSGYFDPQNRTFYGYISVNKTNKAKLTIINDPALTPDIIINMNMNKGFELNDGVLDMSNVTMQTGSFAVAQTTDSLDISYSDIEITRFITYGTGPGVHASWHFDNSSNWANTQTFKSHNSTIRLNNTSYSVFYTKGFPVKYYDVYFYNNNVNYLMATNDSNQFHHVKFFKGNHNFIGGWSNYTYFNKNVDFIFDTLEFNPGTTNNIVYGSTQRFKYLISKNFGCKQTTIQAFKHTGDIDMAYNFLYINTGVQSKLCQINPTNNSQIQVYRTTLRNIKSDECLGNNIPYKSYESTYDSVFGWVDTIIPSGVYGITNATNPFSLNCTNVPYTLTSEFYGDNSTTYQWTFNNNNFSTSKDVVINLPGTYVVSANYGDSCIVIDSLQVTFTNNLSIQTDFVVPVRCNGESNGKAFFSLVNSSNNGDTYTWTGTSAGSGITDSIVNVPAGTYTVTAINNSNGQCTAMATIQIIEPSELVLTTQVTDADCSVNHNNGSIQVSTTGGTPGYSYIWSHDNGLNNSLAAGLVGGVYTVTVVDQNGCMDSAQASIVDISICKDSLYIPQFISPNNDGANDTWEIKGIAFYPNMKVTVLNRWGNKIYEKQPYQNDWDGIPNVSGTLGNGRLPSGTYFYIVDLYGDESDVRTGFLEIKP